MDMERITSVKRKYEEELLKKANVRSVGVGYVWKSGKMTDEVGIVINVDDKMKASRVDDSDMLPSEIEGIRVDVLKTGKIEKEGYTGEARPLQTGYSIGNEFITAGTTGYFAKRDGKVGVTSNAHVLCTDPNKTMSDQKGWSIFQPGPVDGGVEQVATLQTFVQIKKQGDGYNTLDSAWAVLKPGFEFKTTIPEIGEPEGIDVNAPKLGERIRKSGRTTGYTAGNVIQIDVTVNVDYGTFTAVFQGCVLTGNMSAGGDSGSLGITDLNMIKYRLFAGSTSVTVYFPIADEVKDLRLEPIFNQNPEEGIRVDFTMEEEGGTPETKRVYGTVRKQNGDLLKGVSVNLYGESYSQTKVTDEHGNYDMGKVEYGQYTIKITMEGYKTQSKEVEVK